MKFQTICELEYIVPASTTFLLNIRAQNNDCQKVLEEDFTLVPNIPSTHLTDPITGNRFDQIVAEVPGLYHIRYEATVETNIQRLSKPEIPERTLGDFSLEALYFLYPSRYCQSDRLGKLTLEHFGDLTTPLEKASAVVDWITKHISYVSGSTDGSTSAVDSLVERQGVCRDFAHLGIAMCRALNIPARYFTGYAHDLNPPDFHACFETWIGGHWILWDATGLSSPDGVVHIGTGRDAADVAVCTSFGSLKLQRQSVICNSLDDDYRRPSTEELRGVYVSHR